MAALYSPKKKLDKKEATTPATTARGHRRMARPAKGTHAVSKNGPSRPIKSSNSLFHPLNSMYGLFHTATAVITATSTGTPIRLTNKQPGSFINLKGKTKSLRNSWIPFTYYSKNERIEKK